MQVNRDWWDGTARELRVSSIIGAAPVITTCPNLEASVRANLSKYQGVEWDKSICPWKINHNSDFFKFQWALPYYKTGVEGTTMVQSPLFKERKKGYTFYLSAAGGSTSTLPHEIVNSSACTKPLWKTCLSNDELDLTNTDINYWFNLKYRHIYPVINFDYSKIFVAPMIHTESGSGWVFYDDAQIRADWDSTGVYGISLMFYGKDTYNSSIPICAGLFSLNNKFAKPEWDTTNCWKDDDMFDNALAVAWSNAWEGGWEVGGIQTVGSNALWGDDSNNPGFADQTFANENAAGAVMYFPMKNIMIQTPADTEDTIWSTDWDNFYLGGGYNQGTKRHLKSGITYDQFADYLKQQLAYLGFRFCIDSNHFGDSIDSQYYFIPEFDEKGVTTGNYYQANSTEAQSLPNNTWTDDVYDKTPYDGTDDEEDEDPTEWDEDKQSIITTSLGDPSYGTDEWLMSAHALDELVRVLNEFKVAEASGQIASGYCEKAFGSTDPMDCIVSVIKYPFGIIGGWLGDDTDTRIYGSAVGNYLEVNHAQIAVGVSAEPFPYTIGLNNLNEMYKIDWDSSYMNYGPGYIPYYAQYKSFLDYEPYSSAELYVPFCGSVKLDPEIYIGHSIGVEYALSPLDGSCKAFIYRDNLIIDTLTGNMGTAVEISTSDELARANNVQALNATLQAQKMNMVKQAATAAIGTGVALSTGGIASAGGIAAVGSAILNSKQNELSIEQTQFQIDTAVTPFKQLQSGSGFLSSIDERAIRLVVYRPIMLAGYAPAEYGHTTGFACLETNSLSSYTGYTVCANAVIESSATTDEKDMILRALQTGVIL